MMNSFRIKKLGGCVLRKARQKLFSEVCPSSSAFFVFFFISEIAFKISYESKIELFHLNLQVHPGRHLDQPVSIQAHQPRYRRPHPLQYPPEGLALWASGVHPVVWGSTSSKRGPGVLWGATMVSRSNPGVYPGAWYPPDNPGPFSIWSHVCRIFLSFSAFKKKETLCKKFAKSCGITKQVFACAKPLYPWLWDWEYSLSPIIPPKGMFPKSSHSQLPN